MKKIVKVLTILTVITICDINCMELLVNQSKSEHSAVNQKLLNAAAQGNLEQVKEALNEGADINFKFIARLSNGTKVTGSTNRWESALFFALKNGHLGVAKYLIAEKANPEKGSRLLCDLATQVSSFAVLDFLIDQFKMNINESSLILTALSTSNFALIKYMIFNGVETNDLLTIGITVLDMAKNFESISRQMANDDPDNSNKQDVATTSKLIGRFLERVSKLHKIKGTSYKKIVKAVNKGQREKIRETNIMPEDLKNMVSDYSSYPEDYRNFFTLSDDEINEIVKIYSEEEFEKESSEKCSIM